ncbi:Uncharacterised protein [Klebsiella pneumoniae]|nr:Uncharacterised protein [Klebsiella pneumoniae]
MRCCCARTQNLNQPITYYPVSENTMNATTLPILDLARYADPRIKRPSWPTCVMPPATSASSI